MEPRGRYVVFEGGEGLGKTTTMNDLLEFIRSNYNTKIEYTREPGGIEVSEKIRNIVVNDEMSTKTEALLYAASRAEYIEKELYPKLRDGINVLSDRSYVASVVYQGMVKNEGVDAIMRLNKYAVQQIYPDIVIVFDADPKIGLNRISENPDREVNKFDRESALFHEKVRTAYRKLVFYEDKLNTSIHYIDASKEREERLKDVLKILKKENIIVF